MTQLIDDEAKKEIEPQQRSLTPQLAAGFFNQYWRISKIL